MTTTMNHHQVDEDQMALVSQFYPGVYSHMVAQEGERKTRRRRKKAKGETSGVGARKRKLSADQVNMLEQNFGSEHKLESERKDKLALELGLDPRQVAVWFQNRRARWKSKKLEDEYSKLKMSHDKVVVEKCQLESEVLKLKEQLFEAKKAIQQVSERNSEVVSSNSPHSALSMDALDQPFLGEFGVEGFDDAFYVPENNYVNGMMEWVSYY